MSPRESALERIRWSRKFTEQFLPDLTPAEWFWSPEQYSTHVAWQVGHLAVAQYNLCLRRVRGRMAADEALISEPFIDADLGAPRETPHPRCATKSGAVEVCSQHELVHAGQIAMLRRLMGKP